MSHFFSGLYAMMPRTLLKRSLLILVVPILLIQIITALFFVDRYWGEMTTRLSSALAGEVAWVVAEVERGARSDLLFARAKDTFGLDVHIAKDPLPHRHKPRFLWEAMVYTPLEKALNTALSPHPFTLHLNIKAKTLTLEVKSTRGLLHIKTTTTRVFSSSSYIFLLWVGGLSFVLLLVAMGFMRGQVRPILKLAVAAERFGKGRDVPSFVPRGALEVRQAARAFLDMHQRIRRHVSQRTDMLAGVSHDLGAVLTRLTLQLALMPKTPDVQSLQEDVALMARMLEGYLDFVRGVGEETFARIDLRGLIEALADKARKQGSNVHVTAQGEIWAFVRPLGMERALTNLINNAAQHARDIWIEIVKTPKEEIILSIADNGAGIPPENREAVLRPFFRGDTARTPHQGGTGLGLTIAQDSIHAHGGSLHLEDSVHGGLCVVIRIPV